MYMNSCTPISVEPDLCEVAHAAAAHFAVVVEVFLPAVTGDSDDGVLTSVT